MKFDSMGITFSNEVEEAVAGILYNMVIEIRKELSMQYDIYKGEYENYSGLCDLSIIMLCDKLNKYTNKTKVEIVCTPVHGEQQHVPRLDSSFWYYQHTWAIVKMMGVTMYVDPTSGQFKNIYKYIPDFYISTKKPDWFYADSENPLYSNKFIRFLNDHIQISRKVKLSNGVITCTKDGIVEYIQYDIWGKLSNSLNKQEKKPRRKI